MMSGFWPVLLLALASCSKTPKVDAFQLGRTDVESTVTTIQTGTVEAQQDAVLGFTAVGRVERIQVKLGDRVKKGQVLASLENSDLRTSLENARAELNRDEELYREGLVAKVALDDAKRAYDIARANYDKSVIRAPFDGVITELNLDLGELFQGGVQGTGTGINAPRVPIRIVDTQPRIVKGEIDEMDLGRVRVGQPARVRVLAARPQPFPAKVTRVIPFVSTTKEQNRTAQIELGFAEDDRSVPVGASADIEVILEKKSGVLALPTKALLGTGKDRYVFRYEGGRIHKAPVRTGVGNYERVEVLSGLKPGDWIVFPGNEELQDGMKVDIERVKWP